MYGIRHTRHFRNLARCREAFWRMHFGWADTGLPASWAQRLELHGGTGLIGSEFPILVATDSSADSALVSTILNNASPNLTVCNDEGRIFACFERHEPCVLVVAFRELEHGRRYYERLCAQHARGQAFEHRTVLLCSTDDIGHAFALCRDGVFDDYVLFWPMVHDARRLPMSVLIAQRAVASSHIVAPHVRTVAGGEPPSQQNPTPDRAIEAASPSPVVADRVDEFVDDAAYFRRDDAADSHDRHDAPSHTPARPRLLVVDDDRFQCKLLGKLLPPGEYELSFAHSAAEAFVALRTSRHDLILMDVVLPDLDGVEITRRLKAQLLYASLPIVMITGHSDRQVVAESLRAGAVDFIVKPFDRPTLCSKVNKYLRA